MSYILAVNAGSSSFKCALYDNRLQRVDKIQTKTFDELLPFFSTIPKEGLLAIGHRVVHGASRYYDPTIIDKAALKELDTLTELAPLHNAPAVQTIKACIDYFGEKIPQVAVFDTAFYKDMPERSRFYAIPRELSERYEMYRFGFHGISHAYLWEEFVAMTGKKEAKVITLHLGAGCSATAIDSGKPIDTSMGFTPNEGLVMATRSGDINMQMVEYLADKQHSTTQEVLDLFTFKSGLLGLSGRSSDMKSLLPLYDSDKNVRFAIDLFCYRIVKYLGAYMAALQGLDAIIFSGGIGENAPKIRKIIVDAMQWFGLLLQSQANDEAQIKISQERSSVSLYVIPTDENKQIAKEVANRYTQL